MSQTKNVPTQPAVAYPALVGRVIANERERIPLRQGEMAAKLSLSQSAYSRLESGDSVLNVAQLSSISTVLGTTPGVVLARADGLANQLRSQGVEVVDAKPDNAAALVIGLGLLAALLLGGS